MEKDKVLKLMNELMSELGTAKTEDIIDKYVIDGSFDPELSPEFDKPDSTITLEYKGYQFELTREGRLEYAGPGVENGISMGEEYWPAQRIFEAGQDEWNRHINDKAIDNIYNNLMNGKVYGHMVSGKDIKYPFFDRNIELTHSNGNDYFSYSHFGTSAVEATKDQLRWLIDTIFKMTPTEFEKGYELRDMDTNKINIPDIDTFKEYVKDNLQFFLDAKYADAEILFKDIEKAGGAHYEGLIIRVDGEIATPTLKLDQYYEEYKKAKMDLSEVMRAIADDRARFAAGEDMTADKLTELETVRGKIVPKLVNLETSKSYLQDKPYTKLNDMAVMYIAELGDDGRNSKMSMPINNSLLEAYGISKEELHDIAVKNINAQEASVKPLFDVIAEMTGEQIADLPAQMKMFVVTNQNMMFGAAMMLNDAAKEELSEKMGGNGDFVIIPSSIHEILVLPADGIEKTALDAMVLDVNRSVVDPMEQLSDHIYIYNAEAGEIQMPEVYYGEPVFDPERFSKEALSMVEWQAIRDASHKLLQDHDYSAHRVYRSGDTKILECFEEPVAFIHDNKLHVMADPENISNSVKSSITEFANKDAGYQKYESFDDIVNEIKPVKAQTAEKQVQQTKEQPKITPAARDMLFGNEQGRAI
nr:DUF5688 family protein [uncultured Butyrivibrio sp.]